MARHKGGTPPATQLLRISAHSHEYNASGLVLHLPHLRLRRPRRLTEAAHSASTRKKGEQKNRRRRCGRRGPHCPAWNATPWRTRQDQPHPKPTTGSPLARSRLIQRRRRRGPKTLQRCRRAPAPRRRKHPVVAAAAAARQGRRALTPRELRPPTSPYSRGEARLAGPAPPSSQRESAYGRPTPGRERRLPGR